uniref:Uncharacterized protein n=1 Tax=Panagrolaimus davidi TaxID=227884 RepID=A0A914QIE4_9BILA
MFLFVTSLFFALPFIAFCREYTTFEPGDYVFNGEVACADNPPIREDAYVRLMENEPADQFGIARIQDGKFTLKTNKSMTDPTTSKWQLYLEFHNTCDPISPDVSPPIVESSFLKPDKANTGYAVGYTLRHSSSDGWHVDINAF